MSAKAATSPRAAIVVYDGLAIFEFAVACEVFGDQSPPLVDGPWYDFAICGATPTVTLVNGPSLSVPHGLDRLADADIVLVPACESPGGAPPEVHEALRAAHARGARLVSLCTGVFVLAAAGLLAGRRVTTHWTECADLARRYPDVIVDPDVLYVDGGDILTSAGSAAGIDLCLHVVRQDHGAEVATRLARELVVPPYRDGGQAQYIDTPLPTVDTADLFGETLAWMREHLDEPMSVEDLARRSAMSRRTFARRFATSTGTTPYQWLLRQRLHRAQRLLETTDLPIHAVAGRSGFTEATSFRKHFAKAVRTTPHAYRAAFRTRAEQQT